MAALKAEDFKEENMDSLELEHICKEIFSQCDKNIQKYVDVSTLITFIAPFIGSDSNEHLSELRKILDPSETNPLVTFDLFFNAMKIWTAKFSNIASFVSNDRSEFDKKRLSGELKQSTPTKESVEKGVNKNDFDCGLNMSNISSYSYAGSVQSACDPVFLNEQINELQHQNKKLLESLNEVKQQLASSEEVNNNIQNEFDKLKKLYQTDQKLLEDYQKMKFEIAKDREDTNILIKKHSLAVQNLNSCKRENSQLRKNILEYEEEVQKNHELITNLQNAESKLTKKVEKYKKELEIRNNENSALLEKINEMSTMCLEKDTLITEISTELENVRSDNISLNKRLDDIINENTTVKPSKPDSETNPVTDPETEASFEVVFQETESKKEESLQEELIKASNTECLGPHTYCSHQLKIIQYEEDIENLHNKIQQQIDEISNLNKINSELESNIRLLSNQSSSEIEKCLQLQKNNETITATNLKLKSDISLIKGENKRYSRLEQKIKKLEDEVFEEKSKSDNFSIQLNKLQIENERITNNLKLLENEKQKLLVEKNTLQNEFGNLEKKLQENIFEKEKIISENKHLQINLKTLEQKNCELEKFKKLEDEIFEEKSKSDKFFIQLNALLKENERISNEKEKIISENKHLQINLKTCEQKNSELEKMKKLEDEIDEEKSKSDNFAIQLISFQRENERISNNLKLLENEKQKLLAEIVEEKSKSDKFFIQLNSLQRENERISNNLKFLESEKQKLLLERNTIQDEFENLEKNLQEHIFEKEKIISENKDLQLNLKTLEQKNCELEKYVQDELTNEKSINMSLQTELKFKTEQIKILESEIIKIDHEKNNLIIQFNSEKAQTETIKTKLKIELKNVNQKFNELKKQLLEKENELKKLNSENKELKNKNNELVSQINNLSKTLELLEQAKHHLENELSNENLKLKSLSDALSEVTDKNLSLEAINEKNQTRISKLLQNLSNLEQKLQHLRKSSTDLSSSKTEIERNLKFISGLNDNYTSHMRFAQHQIKECRHVLGQNTLNVSKIWKSDLDKIIPDFSIEELTDEGSMSGMMKVNLGMLTEDIKDLRNQTRLTGIMLKALAKIKQDEILAEEDAELSDVTTTSLFVTTSTFSTNETSFHVPHLIPSSPCSMSPECSPQQDMSEEETFSSPLPLPNQTFNLSNGSDGHGVFEVCEEEEVGKRPEQIEENIEEEKDIESSQKAPLKQFRSMSEGTAFNTQVTENGDITLFPNLKDNVLESLGLENGDDSRDRLDRLSEEEIEAKFQTLALIFAIDAKSINQRRELQRRQRDQADRNFHTEVERLQYGVQRLAPLCTDAETQELLQGVMNRINILVKAVQRISISTQIFGGVQQESRISSSISLILHHLRNIHQQRDTLRRQLSCTKRMLQDNSTTEPAPGAVVVSRRLGNANGRVVTRRRASIAAIPRPLDSPSAAGPQGVAGKRHARRISADAYSEVGRVPRPEWLPVSSGVVTHPQIRLSRPSRIELGIDLTKIHEGSVENIMNNNEESDSDVAAFVTPTALVPTPNLFLEHTEVSQPPDTFSDHLFEVIRALVKFIMYCWNRWFRNGTTREIILFLVLFSLAMWSIFSLNAMIVCKPVNQGSVIYPHRIPWSWLTWDELWNIIFDVRIAGPY